MQIYNLQEMGEREGLNFEVERMIRTLLRGGRRRMAQVRMKLVLASLVLQYVEMKNSLLCCAAHFGGFKSNNLLPTCR